jgi:phosphatidate cytidylyltransferase
MAVTGLMSWLAAPLLTPLNTTQAIAVGIIIALASFIGYITLAAIKADLQLKDRGTMTPGQGGILNRVDTLIYTAPIFFHVIYYLYY